MAARGWVEPTRPAPGSGWACAPCRSAPRTSTATTAVGLVAGVLDELSRRFGETVHLGRLDGDARSSTSPNGNPSHPLRLYSAIGRRLPAHATALGKALLAERADDEVDAMLPGRCRR